jgi:hypothetical protein
VLEGTILHLTFASDGRAVRAVGRLSAHSLDLSQAGPSLVGFSAFTPSTGARYEAALAGLRDRARLVLAGILLEEEHRSDVVQTARLTAIAFRVLEADVSTTRRAISEVQSDLVNEETDLQSAQLGEETISANTSMEPGVDPSLICLYIAAADTPNGLIVVNERPAIALAPDAAAVRSAVDALNAAVSSTSTAEATLARRRSQLTVAETLAAPYVPPGVPPVADMISIDSSAISDQSDAVALSATADSQATQLAVDGQGILDSETTAVNEVETACASI